MISNLVELFWQNVWDVIPWVTVQSLLQTLLVHVMTNKTDATAEHEQWVDGANVDVLLSFLTANDSNKV